MSGSSTVVMWRTCRWVAVSLRLGSGPISDSGVGASGRGVDEPRCGGGGVLVGVLPVDTGGGDRSGRGAGVRSLARGEAGRRWGHRLGALIIGVAAVGFLVSALR